MQCFVAILALIACTCVDAADVDTAFLSQPVSSEESLRPIMEQTTAASAVSIVNSHNSTPASLKELINVYLLQGTASKHSLRNIKHDASMSKKSLADAKKMLSDMIAESVRKLDLEQIKCSDYDATQTLLIQSTRGEISSFNAQSAEAREQILAAEASLEKINVKLPELNIDMTKNNNKCLTNIGSLQTQIKVITADLEVMGRIVELASCRTTMLMLLQCKHNDTGRSFITFGRRALRRQLGLLGSSVSKLALHRALTEALGGAGDANFSVSNPLATAVSDKPRSKRKQQAKCAYTNGTNCRLVRDRMITIDSGIKEKARELSKQLFWTETDCASTKADFEAQIALQEGLQKSSQARLASGTRSQNEADEQSRLKTFQLNKLIRDHAHEMKLCRTNIRNFQGEICAVRKIRGELMKLAGENVYANNIAIKDCAVGPWSSESCTVTCGGGTQKISRSVITPARNGGAKCPPLMFEEKCNQDECPVDCVVDQWTGWSSCSAKCGGGIMERERSVVTMMKFNGKPCGETSETQSCGIASCDKDCELSQWTQWSSCSKLCNGGLQTRFRDVDEPKEGAGVCASGEDPSRLGYKPCNIEPCVVSKGEVTLKCASKVDVIILIDGSGSLKQTGWDASVKAATMLVEAFKTHQKISRVAVQIFSGPSKYKDAKKCASGDESMDPLTSCGITWVSHFTDDLKGLADKVKAAKWPKSYTLTSLALSLAEDELAGSRQGTKSVVVVITDGRPLNRAKTGNAAKNIRKKARLMWVPVTTYAPLKDIKKWASKPVKENVIQVMQFKILKKASTISTLIADMCPKVS